MRTKRPTAMKKPSCEWMAKNSQGNRPMNWLMGTIPNVQCNFAIFFLFFFVVHRCNSSPRVKIQSLFSFWPRSIIHIYANSTNRAFLSEFFNGFIRFLLFLLYNFLLAFRFNHKRARKNASKWASDSNDVVMMTANWWNCRQSQSSSNSTHFFKLYFLKIDMFLNAFLISFRFNVAKFKLKSNKRLVKIELIRYAVNVKYYHRHGFFEKKII